MLLSQTIIEVGWIALAVCVTVSLIQYYRERHVREDQITVIIAGNISVFLLVITLVVGYVLHYRGL